MVEERPAAWYPDLQVPGQQRYWDGTAWTDHVAPLGKKTHPVRWAIAVGVAFAVIMAVVIVNKINTGNDPVILLSVGECLGNNPDSYQANARIENMRVVPCSDEHYMEVFYVYEHSDSEVPSSPGFTQAAFARCDSRAGDYIAKEKLEPGLRLFLLNPTPGSWYADKSTACLVYLIDESSGAAQSVTGSLSGDN